MDRSGRCRSLGAPGLSGQNFRFLQPQVVLRFVNAGKSFVFLTRNEPKLSIYTLFQLRPNVFNGHCQRKPAWSRPGGVGHLPVPMSEERSR